MAYCVVVCFLFLDVLNLLVEVSAGSLAPGCLSSKHFSFPKQRMVVFGVQDCGLGDLVPPFRHPWDHFSTLAAPGVF